MDRFTLKFYFTVFLHKLYMNFILGFNNRCIFYTVHYKKQDSYREKVPHVMLDLIGAVRFTGFKNYGTVSWFVGHYSVARTLNFEKTRLTIIWTPG